MRTRSACAPLFVSTAALDLALQFSGDEPEGRHEHQNHDQPDPRRGGRADPLELDRLSDPIRERLLDIR